MDFPSVINYRTSIVVLPCPNDEGMFYSMFSILNEDGTPLAVHQSEPFAQRYRALRWAQYRRHDIEAAVRAVLQRA